jgi:hypothetical protein
MRYSILYSSLQKFLIMKSSARFQNLFPALLLMAGLACGTLQAQTKGAGNLSPQKAAAKASVDKAEAQQAPLALIPNKGQWPKHILYKADMPGGQALVTKEGMIAGIFDPASLQAVSDYHILSEQWLKDQEGPEPKAPAGIKGHGWRIRFTGGNAPSAQTITDAGKSGDYYNWMGNTASGKDVLGIHSYAEVTYHNVYNGVDVRYYGAPDGSGLENDIIVAPGADADKVAFALDGINNYEVTKEGTLTLHTSIGDVAMAAPVSYTIDKYGAKTPVPSRYKLNADRSIGFYTGNYDRKQKLVIDPIVMRWSLYLSGAGTGISHNHAIDIDKNGNIYTAGLYGSAGLITVNAFQTTFGGGLNDILFAEYTEPATVGGPGVRLWQTYVGNASNDQITAIVIGPDGNIYASGIFQSGTSVSLATHFGTLALPVPAYSNTTFSGVSSNHSFIFKITPDGQSAIARTFLCPPAGTSSEVLLSMGVLPGATATSFNLAASGFIQNLPASVGAGGYGDLPQPTLPNGTAYTTGAVEFDVIAFSVTPNFETYNWKRMVGTNGNGTMLAYSQAIDAANRIYLGGQTSSASGASFANPSAQTVRIGAGDGLIMQLSPAGIVNWSRYFNCTATNSGTITAMNISNDNTSLLVTGVTSSLSAANITAGAFQTAHTNPGNTNNYFVAKLPLSGASITWGTYVGGGAAQNVMGINSDANNDVYILGYNRDISATLGAGPNPVQAANLTVPSATPTATFSKLSANGASLLYSTFLGGVSGANDPIGNNGIKFANCRIYLAISSADQDFPLTAGTITSTKTAATTLAAPVLVSMANPPDFTAGVTVLPATQNITCGSTAADVVHSGLTYNIPAIIRNNITQTNGTATAYPSGVPAVNAGTLQWQRSIDAGSTWTNIAGATGSLTLTSAQIGTVFQDTRYRLITGGDACNRDDNPVANITVGGDPAAAPSTSCVAGNATFSANATGTGTLTYAWTLPAATTRPNPGNVANFVLTGILPTDAGIYQLTVTNAGGCKTTKTYKYNAANCSFIVVPVKLAAFDARKDDSGTKSLLSWMVTEEINTTGYTVQRSRNGTDWDEIGYTPAQGAGTQQANYHFTDASPAPGINYYRLLITDVNGAGSYSPIRMLKYDNLQQAPISAYPNPASSAVVITGVSNGETLSLYSSDGRLVATLAATGYTQSLDISRLAAGTYILKAESGSAAPRTLKVVKQ